MWDLCWWVCILWAVMALVGKEHDQAATWLAASFVILSQPNGRKSHAR